MAVFSAEAFAKNDEATEKGVATGFTYEFKFRPAETVYTMTDNGIISAQVLSVRSEHRSITGKTENIESRAVYTLNNSMDRNEEQLFDQQTAEAIKALLSV